VFGRRYLDEFGVATTRPFGPSEEES
jgi:hypothetical protein